MRHIFYSFLGVKKQEALRAFVLFANFFSIIACYYVVKSVRGALVIESLGADMLPYIWAISVFILFAFVSIYGNLVDRLSRDKVIVFVSLFFVVSLLVIKYFLTESSTVLTAVFYIWCDLFSVIMVEQFWSFTNDSYRVGVAKRIYAFIGSGGILGGIFGSVLVGWLVPFLGTANMIYFSLVMILGIVALFMVAHKMCGKYSSVSNESRKLEWDFFEGFQLIKKNRYLMLIATILVLTQVLSTVIDFQFNKIVEKTVTGLNEKSQFFGNFYALMNLMGLLVLFLVARPVMRFYGVIVALIILPLVNFVGVFSFLLVPLPMVIFALKLMDKSLNYSVFRVSKETLYITTTYNERYKAKAVIDMFGYRASKILGSAIIIPISAFMSLKQMNLVCLMLAAGIITAIYFLKLEKSKLKENIEIKDFSRLTLQTERTEA